MTRAPVSDGGKNLHPGGNRNAPRWPSERPIVPNNAESCLATTSGLQDVRDATRPPAPALGNPLPKAATQP